MTGHVGILPAWLIVSTSLLYVMLLFGVAYYGDRRAARGRTLVANPWIYALSIAVYCTAWTFYGSVGRAASGGVEYLTIYLGPTLMFALGAVLFSPLVIGIFDCGAGVGIFGLPLLYFYLFASWALLIVLLAWVIERPAGGRGGTPAEPSRERLGRDRGAL